MMLRVPPFSAMLAAGVALSLVPAVHSSIAQGRSSSDVTTQRSSQSPYQGAVVEDIVAMVNDQVISKSDYDRAQQDLDAEAKQQGWSQQQLMEQRRDLLRSLIDKQLLLSKGKDLGINGETEVVKRLDEMRKQYHMDTMEDLQKAAEAQGVSFEDLKQNIRDGVITSEVISQEVGSHIQIAPSEIQAYYSAHQQEFERPEQEKLGEILIAKMCIRDSSTTPSKSGIPKPKAEPASNFMAMIPPTSSQPSSAPSPSSQTSPPGEPSCATAWPRITSGPPQPPNTSRSTSRSPAQETRGILRTLPPRRTKKTNPAPPLLTER